MLDKLTAISNASFLGKLLRFPFRLMPDSATLPVLTGINRGMKWIAGSATHGAWLGTYESDKQQQLARLLKSGMTFYDVGANAGFYTLAAARLVGERGHVFAFEPLAENVANLRRHVQLNQLQNVSIIQAAVADTQSLSGFNIAPSRAMGSLSEGADYWVPTVSLDQAIASYGLLPPDIIKLDVEGAESRVLAGAEALLRAGKATWLIALHGDAQRTQCLNVLQSYGYRVHRVDGIALEALLPDERMVDEIVAFPPGAN